MIPGNNVQPGIAPHNPPRLIITTLIEMRLTMFHHGSYIGLASHPSSEITKSPQATIIASGPCIWSPPDFIHPPHQSPAAGPTDGPAYVAHPPETVRRPPTPREQSAVVPCLVAARITSCQSYARDSSPSSLATRHIAQPRRAEVQRGASHLLHQSTTPGSQGGPGNKARNRTAEVLGAAD